MEYTPWLQLGKFEKIVFFQIFFNQDISLNISLRHLTFVVLIDNTHMEGILSQIFYLGPSYLFMKSRKNILQKIAKSYPFFQHKM